MSRSNKFRSRAFLAAVVSILGLAGFLLLSRDSDPLIPSVEIAALRDPEFANAVGAKPVVVEGVVTATFLEDGELGGYFLQQDRNQAVENRSHGIFIKDRSHRVSTGERVRVFGQLGDSAGLATIEPAEGTESVSLTRLRGEGPIEPVIVSQPIESIDWESYEGMLVTLPGEWVVVDTYNLARYGQLSIAPERLYVPTNSIDPNDDPPSGTNTTGVSNRLAVQQAQAANDSLMLNLDDGIVVENRFPIPLLPELGQTLATVRLGSKIHDLRGIVVEQKGNYFMLPVGPLALQPEPRPPRPTVGDASVTVASFNVLNYFVTLADGTNQARGANSTAELDRQRKKLVAAILELDADVLGLIELENGPEAEQDLVATLNEALGGELFVGCGLPDRFERAFGAHGPIRNGIIYRQDRVEPVGPIEVISDRAFANARTPLVQKFRRLEGEDEVVVVVNHFKSKGAQSASGDDVDQQDGQAAFNASRRSQAEALAKYVGDVAASGDDKILILGDLNAYREEDPIDTLRAAGLVDLLDLSSEQNPYTFVYFGQAGALDHAFATPQLASLVTGTEVWHINADEPRTLDYNLEFKPETLYQPDPFRSSDHDPLLIGLMLDGE